MCSCIANAIGRNWPRWSAPQDSLRDSWETCFPVQLWHSCTGGAPVSQSAAGICSCPFSGFIPFAGTAGICCFWKHDRQSTGRPWVGLKGTVVSVPHSEHVVRVSDRTRGPPRTRLALHCLQCLGSFLNCLSWKNSCSPAVNTKSAPQSLHFNTLSMNSMAGFPGPGRIGDIGHDCLQLAAPDSLSSFVLVQQGPGPQKSAASF